MAFWLWLFRLKTRSYLFSIFHNPYILAGILTKFEVFGIECIVVMSFVTGICAMATQIQIKIAK